MDSTKPVIKLRGQPTVNLLKKRYVVRGTASDASGIARIDVRARGMKSRVRLIEGRFEVTLQIIRDQRPVVVELRAIDRASNRSKPVMIKIPSA